VVYLPLKKPLLTITIPAILDRPPGGHGEKGQQLFRFSLWRTQRRARQMKADENMVTRKGISWEYDGKTMPVGLPSGYLTIRHGKIHPFLIGKPSISMGHLYHGYVSHNQRVSKNGIFGDWIF